MISPEETVLSQVTVTHEQARGRSGCPAWYEECQWGIIASFFGRVCKQWPTTSPCALVNSIVNQQAYQLVPLSCAWGNDNEDKAVRAYLQFRQRKGHPGIKVATSGFVITSVYAWLGASPDGLVTEPHSLESDGINYKKTRPLRVVLGLGSALVCQRGGRITRMILRMACRSNDHTSSDTLSNPKQVSSCC